MPNETPAPVTPAAAPAQIEATPAALITLKDRIEAAKEKAIQAGAPVQAPAAQVETPPTQKAGTALARLAREQKAAREAQDAVKRERAAFDADRRALDADRAKVKAFEEAQANAKRFPLKYLESLGLTYQDVAEAQMNGGDPTPNLEVKAVRGELEKMRQEQADREKRDLEQQKQAAQVEQSQIVEAFQSQCVAFVDQNPEKYELTAKFGAQDQVFKVINAHAELQVEQGVPPDKIKILSLEEAAESVEKYFEGQLEVIRTAKKFTAKQGSTPQTKSPFTANRTVSKPPAQTTLSNTGSAPGSSNGAQPETWAQRRARVYAKLN